VGFALFQTIRTIECIFCLKTEQQTQLLCSEIEDPLLILTSPFMFEESYEWAVMMSFTYLWMNRGVSLELSYYCSFFWVDWMLPVEMAERRHGLEKMLSLPWHLDFMDRFQNIWNLRQHCLGWQHACALVWIILKLELS